MFCLAQIIQTLNKLNCTSCTSYRQFSNTNHEDDPEEVRYFIEKGSFDDRRRSFSMTVVETVNRSDWIQESREAALDALSNRGTSHLHGFLAQRRTRSRTIVTHAQRSRASSFKGDHVNSPHVRARKVSFRVKRGTPVMAVRKTPILPFNVSGEIEDGEEVQYGRRNSISAGTGMKRSTRRCSEPFLFNAPLSSKLKKQSFTGRGPPHSSRRRLSTTAALLPATSKHKLHALAKDELLASLNLPLDVSDQHPAPVIKEEDAKVCTISTVEEESQRCEEQRIKVIEEILETEKKYLNCLTTLDQVFRKPMLEGGIVPEKDIKLIFPSVLIELQECHCWFMKELEERIRDDNWKGIIGDTFAKLSDSSTDNLLEMYMGYVNAFPKSVSTLSRYTRTSQKFRKFLEVCSENPQCDSLELTSFLLTPVQRLPRYVLLLRQLMKYTDQNHLDFGHVSEALQKMEGLIESLNGSIQNSMQVYSAGESERRKMIRRQLSRRRKKTKPSPIEIRFQNSSIGRPVPLSPLTPTVENGRESRNSTGNQPANFDPDTNEFRRGLSEESYQTQQPLNRRSSSTPDVLSSSECMSRTSSVDNDNSIPFRNRNSETRKSWRRSFGAMFSSMWSGKDDKDFDTVEKLASPSIEHSPQDKMDEQVIKKLSVGQDPENKPTARRKYGVSYTLAASSPVAQDELVDKDSELNNNDQRRKVSTSSRDKKRSSWLSLNGWKRSLTPPTSDDELSSSVESTRTKNRNSLTRSTSSSVISERERRISEVAGPPSPTFHRSIKARLSGRSTGLSSFFYKAKQRHDSDSSNTQVSLCRSVETVSQSIDEDTEVRLPNGNNVTNGQVGKTVIKRSPTFSRKLSSKTRRRSAPVQVAEEGQSSDRTREEALPSSKKAVVSKDHEKQLGKPPLTTKDSKGKFKKALKHIVGRTKS